jgi:peptidoglycan hydrolase CwlO-like protein
LERGPEIFADKRKPENQDQEKKIAHLERKVGQYAVEVDWLQKKIEGIPLI